MKVHIQGRGMVYTLGLNAPVKNIDLTESQIRRIIPVRSLQVVDAATNVVITRHNVDSFFTAEEPVKVPTPTKKKETKKKEEPVVVDTVEESVIEEPVEAIEVVAEETATIESEEETVSEAIVDYDEDIEEVETTTEESYVPKKKNKKRR